MDSCSKGCYSYAQWAASAGHCLGMAVSKQAVFERVNQAASARFACAAFKHVMGSKLAAVTDGTLFARFRRVLLQDSTTLRLPETLAGHYAGSSNGDGQHAVLRLQCLINIKAMQWLDISLRPFTSNDQSASGMAVPLLRKGDLLIRDLGYFALNVFEQVQQQQAFYISRLKYGVNLYDTMGNVVNWKHLCSKKGIIDQVVVAGAKQKLSVRIVMVPLPQQQVAEKVRRARKDRDKRLKHSPDYYLWLRYNVFITNVPNTMLEAGQIAETYKVRWQIEMVFKAWKSCLNMQKALHSNCTNIHRAETTIYLVLMFFCLIVQKVYMPHNRLVHQQGGAYLSLLKVCRHVWVNLIYCINLPPQKLKQVLIKHCCYESRNDRTNMTEIIRNKKL